MLEAKCESTQRVSQAMNMVKSDHETINMLVDIVISQDQKIKELDKSPIHSEAKSLKPMIMITGILEKYEENPVQVVDSFFKQTMKIPEKVQIELAYRIGNNMNRPLIVKLKDPGQKRLIHSHTENLRRVKNERGSFYYVSNMLPNQMNEKRRQLREWVKINKKLPVAKRLQMSIKKGKLIIDGKEHKPEIEPPNVKAILKMPQKEQDLANKLVVKKGGVQVEIFSRFISYAVKVKDVQDVQHAYYRVKKGHMYAHLVMCAYRLVGCKGPKLPGIEDDGEDGAGRAIIYEMIESGVHNVAVFVVRYYGGIELGKLRYQIIEDLTTKAISRVMTRMPQMDSIYPITDSSNK